MSELGTATSDLPPGFTLRSRGKLPIDIELTGRGQATALKRAQREPGVQPKAAPGAGAPPPGFVVRGEVPQELSAWKELPVSAETEGAADILDVVQASLANDPYVKIQHYSKEMNIPIDQFGVRDGDIVYETEPGSGKLQKVEAGFWRGAASGVGPAIPAVAGAAGTIAGLAVGAPTVVAAPATAAAGGLTGAAAGQTAREVAAHYLLGQDPSAMRVVGEAALDLAATVTGLLVGKGLSRAAASKAGTELHKALGKGGEAAMTSLKRILDDINAKYGTEIKLTPAEISNARTLRAQQIAVDNTQGAGAQAMQDFRADRGIETGKAFKEFTGDISPEVSPDVAGEQLATAAGGALKRLGRERAEKGGAAYREAFEKESVTDISHAIAVLDDEAAKFPPAREILARVRAQMGVMVKKYGGPEGSQSEEFIPHTDLEHMQNAVKEPLDDEISAAYRAGKNKLAGRLQRVKDALLDAIDIQAPLYQAARKLWGDLSEPVTKAKGGILPSLAKKTSKDWEDMGRKFLSTASPKEIERAKDLIFKVRGGADAWNATLKGFLEQRWEQAGRVHKSKIGNEALSRGAQPSSFWAEMAGNPDQLARMEKAFSPDQFEAFKNLMKVFEATGRATNYNSTTVAQGLGQQMLEGSTASAQFLKSINVLGWARRAEDSLNTVTKAMNVDALVEVMTSTDSVKELLKISGRQTDRDQLVMLGAKAINLAGTFARSGAGSDRVAPSTTRVDTGGVRSNELVDPTAESNARNNDLDGGAGDDVLAGLQVSYPVQTEDETITVLENAGAALARVDKKVNDLTNILGVL